MSVWGRRGTYGATVTVVTVWILLSALAHFGRPFIDQKANDDLATSRSDFMRAGQFQRVKWRVWGDDVVLEARRTDKPLFLFVGHIWGDKRQQFDRLFEVPEVAEFMNQEFVCVRVDSLAKPIWRGGPAPLARRSRSDGIDLYVAVFSPDGQMVALPDMQGLISLGDSKFLAFLRTVLNEQKLETNPMRSEARREADAMRGGVSSAGSEMEGYGQLVGLQLQSPTRLLPYEYEFMLDLGRRQQVEESVGEVLVSPAVNVLGGGFFERWKPGYQEIEFYQSGFTNGGMLRVLARLASVSRNDAILAAAQWQFRFVADRFAVSGASASDAAKWELARRSKFYSIPRDKLRDEYPESVQYLARNELGLGDQGRLQALPRFLTLVDWLGVNDQEFGELRDALREKLPDRREVEGVMVSFEVQAEAVESMLLAARLIGDKELEEESLAAFGELRGRMRAGVDDVAATSDADVEIEAGLSTYLAYAAAAWEAMLLTGDEEIGWDGVRVLNRAVFLFRDESQSMWPGRISSLPVVWREVMSPPILDGSIRSGMGQFIRLCDVYAAWNGSKSFRGSLIRARDKAYNQTSWVMDEGIFGIGTLGRGVRQVNRGVAIGVSGDVDWAFWEKSFPGVPLVRLEDKGEPGFWVYVRGEWEGPVGMSRVEELTR